MLHTKHILRTAIDDRERHRWRAARRCDSITITVVGLNDLLDSVIYLVTMDRRVPRSRNAKPDFVAPDLDDHHADVITDADFLIGFSAQN
jgi:hypothetical protein